MNSKCTNSISLPELTRDLFICHSHFLCVNICLSTLGFYLFNISAWPYSLCLIECVFVCVCVCVCERERDRERDSVCMCMWGCVGGGGRERDRERDSVCMCMCVCVCVLWGIRLFTYIEVLSVWAV